MTLKWADRVKETTTTTGTGPVTLGGAATGYQPFGSVLANGDTCYYEIADQPPGVNWETGLGTYGSAGNTLTRTVVLSSSNGGAAVNFGAGTKDVFLDLPSDRVTKTPFTDQANTFTTGQQTIQTGADGNVGLRVKGNSGTQSANIFDVTDQNGFVLTSVVASGAFAAYLSVTSQTLVATSTCQAGFFADPNNTVSYLVMDTDSAHGVTVNVRSTTRIPFTIQGLTGHTTLLQLKGTSSTGTSREQVNFDVIAVDNTDATRKYRLVLSAWDTAAREGLRVEASGAVAKIGFLGAAAVVQQANASQAAITAVTDANAKAALQALYNLLVNYGLAPATA